MNGIGIGSSALCVGPVYGKAERRASMLIVAGLERSVVLSAPAPIFHKMTYMILIDLRPATIRTQFDVTIAEYVCAL
ncbi:hypothetical protein [Azospirillum sp. SYSU D00513]|uniref:hypothetical protein n=1 Tax=Azospirillum sp. SYSU D00513 TaxID=2812561 RepID=UPI001A975FEA|nr:hypothetical protein [Azospirillum sp. SYSU D00513]